MLSPAANPASANDPQVAAALDKLNTALATMQARQAADLAAERVRAKTEFLDTAFRELKGTDEGAIQRLQAQFDQSVRLAADVAARDAEIRELKSTVEDARSKLQSAQILGQREEKRLQARIDELAAENARIKADLNKSRERLSAASGDASPATEEAQDKKWWWLSGGAAAIVALVAGAWWFAGRTNGSVEQPSTQT
jgi:hypothetical protein